MNNIFRLNILTQVDGERDSKELLFRRYEDAKKEFDSQVAELKSQLPNDNYLDDSERSFEFEDCYIYVLAELQEVELM